MSFYEDQLRSLSDDVVQMNCKMIEQEVHLDDVQFAALLLDGIFDEFRTTSGWPENQMKFCAPHNPLSYKSKPSEILTPMNDGAFGVTATFICGKQKVEELVTIRSIDGAKFEFKFGPESVVFSLAEMPCCPPFAPGIVMEMLGARLVMGALQTRFQQ